MRRKQPPIYMAERRRDHSENLVQEILIRRGRSRIVRRDTNTGDLSPAVINQAGSTEWKLEDAKAHFSEVVRRARTEGPQLVTKRGKHAVVVIAVEELQRLQAPKPPRKPFVEFMESLHVPGLDLDFPPERDTGREIDL